MGMRSVIPIVLLILRGVHARVIGGHNDQPRLHARVGEGEEGISRHVQPDMLHGHERPRPRE